MKEQKKIGRRDVLSVTKQMVGIMLIAVATACGRGGEQPQQTPVLKVYEVAAGNSQQNEIYPATLKGKQDIDLRPQISGFITRVLVDEGAQVRKGQLLFEIDRVQYEEAVNVAKAAVAVAETAVSTAQLTATNKRELAKKNVISEYEKKVSDNQLAQAKSQLAQARASLVSARDHLQDCHVCSPSNGVVGKINFRVGALVSPETPTPLTIVSENDKIYANFSITEKKLLALYGAKGSQQKVISSLPKVKLQLSDGSLYPIDGKIATISGVIDPKTGSVNVRAEFDNRNGLLRSGGTGNLLIPHQQNNVLQIPQEMTYEIQNQHFVYKVDAKGKLSNMPIEVDELNDGKNYIVTKGLKIGDHILAEGLTQVQDGETILIKNK